MHPLPLGTGPLPIMGRGQSEEVPLISDLRPWYCSCHLLGSLGDELLEPGAGWGWVGLGWGPARWGWGG